MDGLDGLDGKMKPASSPPSAAAMGQASRVPTLSSARRDALLSLLVRLGLDPRAAGGPGATSTALAPIEEALTHASAGRPRHHEQLEFLGDAVLRLAATEFLDRCHPALAVGRRSALRAQLVSDRWLAEQAEVLDLAPLLHLGPMALGDASGRATVLAECCEALVGAVYQAWGGTCGGIEAVLLWLAPAWEQASAELLADPERHNWKTALQEKTQGRGLGLPRYDTEEVSRRHGDPRRFQARVSWGEAARDGGSEAAAGGSAEGWGGSRREAEQQAARAALAQLRAAPGSPGAR
jgi:ribonuclease-3